jgi:hypothetical protein
MGFVSRLTPFACILQNSDVGKPCKIEFNAPASHSALDRIRIVDINAEVPIWLQVSKTVQVPPGMIALMLLRLLFVDRVD